MLPHVGPKSVLQILLNASMGTLGERQDDVLSFQKLVPVAVVWVFFEFLEGSKGSGSHLDGIP